MGRLTNRSTGDRAKTVLKIAAAVFFALVVAGANAALVALFLGADYLPGAVRWTVLFLCLVCLYADFRLTKKYVDALLDEVED